MIDPSFIREVAKQLLQGHVPTNPILAANRARFSYTKDITTYTPFGFFESGYLIGRHTEHISPRADCLLCQKDSRT